MAQAKGSNGQLLAGVTEVTYNVNPATSASVALPFVSFGVKETAPLIRSKTINSNRNAVQPTVGNIALSGPIVVPLDELGMGHWLRMLLGNPVTTGTNPYTHVFKVGTSINSHVFEQGYTDIAQFQRLNGGKVGTMALSLDQGANAEPVVTFGVTAATSTWSGSSMDSTPAVEALTVIPFGMAAITLKEGGSLIATAQSVALTEFTNGLDDKGYCIGNAGALATLPEGIAYAKGTLKAMFENLTLLNKALNGTESSIEIIGTNGTHSISFKFNEVQYAKTSPAIQGPLGIWVELEWEAYYNNHADASILTATLINTHATYTY